MDLPDDPVVYQIYPRSFQDSNGDGIGDLRGITSRLDHLQELGVDALWMSPVFRSPMADFGYDVSDYLDVAPEYGTIDDLDELIDQARQRNIGVLLDMILPHTSIEHRWFRERPDFYIWSDGVPNNWPSHFGGSAWQYDEQTGRHYLHRFYPQQADLNWRNPDVREAMYAVMRFWLDRGVAGFRLDAIDGLFRRADLADMPPRAEPPRLPAHEAFDALQAEGYESNLPETHTEMHRLRDAFPDAWFVAEAFRPLDDLDPYVAHMNAAFNFEFLLGDFSAPALGDVLRRSPSRGIAWTLSNHDFSRLVTRGGRDLARVAAVLLLTLPGAAFIYQGDEIGMVDGPGAPSASLDRYGRDKFRHPMQWTPDGGFTTGDPWLPMIDPQMCNVRDQLSELSSMVNFYRRLIDLRRSITGPMQVVHVSESALVFERGEHVIICNFGNTAFTWPFSIALVESRPTHAAGIVAPRSATIAKAR